jgi:hypothetical protein
MAAEDYINFDEERDEEERGGGPLNFHVFVVRETDKAWLVVLADDVEMDTTPVGEIMRVDDDVKVWLPKSRCSGDLEVGEYGYVDVPEWIATAKGWT